MSFVVTVLNVNYHYLRTRFHVFTPGIGYLYQRFVEPELRKPSTDSASVGEVESENESESEGESEGAVQRQHGHFIYELHRARHLSSKDPRDYVYAFLGHFTLDAERSSAEDTGDGLAGIQPDYSRPVADVYIDVAIRGLTDASSLIILSTCHNIQSTNRNSRVIRRKMDLPSWVPDWRVLPLHVLSSPDTPHRACGDQTTPKLSIDKEAYLLDISGVRVDTVSQRWAPFDNFSFQMHKGKSPSSPDFPSAPAIQSLWTRICGKTAFTLEDPYVDSQTPAFFALLHTLTNKCISADRRLADDPKADWLANGAAYLVSSAAGASPELPISPELRTLAESGTPYKWSHEATLVSRYRSFGVTRKGYYLLGPDVIEEADVVVVLFGGRVPFLLRPYGNWWKLLGECYVHGVMDGEALGMGAKEEVFTIS